MAGQVALTLSKSIEARWKEVRMNKFTSRAGDRKRFSGLSVFMLLIGKCFFLLPSRDPSIYISDFHDRSLALEKYSHINPPEYPSKVALHGFPWNIHLSGSAISATERAHLLYSHQKAHIG